MKVQNMTSNNGNKVPNQFIIIGDGFQVFQSYDSAIARIEATTEHGFRTLLDQTFWNYSRTTAKYRNQFLGETTKETQAKIDSGEYILTDLNG